MQQMTHETLDTGLGSFRDSSPDYILAPVGLASMQDQAQKLAEYGRNGDVYIVHAAQGETVIPLEVLNANPKVKGLLYKQMRDMGLDPKEFVVGDELNSINPVTGLPEFFFKKIFRAVKKVVKKVVNVAKKIAPIALPLIAATFGFPFLGTAFKAGTFGATALAGGLGTLAQGGSFKDALKSGLMAGGIASLTGGLKTLGTDKSFMSGVERSFTGAGAPSWQTQWGRLQEGELGDFLLAKPEDPLKVAGIKSGLIGPVLEKANVPSVGTTDQGRYILTGGLKGGQNPATAWQQSQLDKYAKKALATKAKDAPWYSSLWGGPSVTAEDVATTMGGNAETFLKQVPSSAMTKSLKLVNPNVAQKWGPTVVGGLGVAGAVGAFGAPDVKQPEARSEYKNPFNWRNLVQRTNESDADFLARQEEMRLRHELPGEALDPTLFAQGPYVIPPYSSQQRMFGADGGMAAYPRRELLVEGPGTERSDDIPAMLSDGEFVWNAKAVRGADPSGRGDRYAGARNLYDMMRNFEMKS
jgi:hypothetical protein|tara:strand:- start:1723 stop:3300 length:1578 start_codon:yes stop_codon:yes gene_type:complete